MKRVFIVVLAVLILSVFPGVAAASEDAQDKVPDGEMGVCFTYINFTTISFDISGTGYATMGASVGAVSEATTRISAYLQRYNGEWQTLQHYSDNGDTYYLSWDAGRYVPSGYQYRLLVYYYAYVDGNSESTSMTSYEYY